MNVQATCVCGLNEKQVLGGGLTFREKTTSEVLMVLAMVVAWYANISDRPGEVMLPDLFCADLGGTIQSMGSDSSLPNRLVPCHNEEVQ